MMGSIVSCTVTSSVTVRKGLEIQSKVFVEAGGILGIVGFRGEFFVLSSFVFVSSIPQVKAEGL
jgi:hypothetical protein